MSIHSIRFIGLLIRISYTHENAKFFKRKIVEFEKRNLIDPGDDEIISGENIRMIWNFVECSRDKLKDSRNTIRIVRNFLENISQNRGR